jgi:hypothetical protein
VHHYNPEEKRQLVKYRDNSFCPKMFKVQVPLEKRNVVTTFWDGFYES